MSKSNVFLKVSGGLCLLALCILITIMAMERLEARNKEATERTAMVAAEARRRMLAETLESDRETIWGGKIRATQKAMDDAMAAWKEAMANNQHDKTKEYFDKWKEGEDKLNDLKAQMLRWERDRK